MRCISDEYFISDLVSFYKLVFLFFCWGEGFLFRDADHLHDFMYLVECETKKKSLNFFHTDRIVKKVLTSSLRKRLSA